MFFVATCGEPLGLLMLTTHSSGEEIVYAIEDLLEYQVDGRPPALKAGEVLFISTGAVHAVKNVGSGNAADVYRREREAARRACQVSAQKLGAK